MDETYFCILKKGIKGRKRGGSTKKRGISKEQVCVLVARDRYNLTFSHPSGMECQKVGYNGLTMWRLNIWTIILLDFKS